MGSPGGNLTDNGRQFVSQTFQTFLLQHGVRHCKTALYFTPANIAVERLNRVVKDCLKTARGDDIPPITALWSMLPANRTTPHATTGVTTAEIMLGRQIRPTLNLLNQKWLNCSRFSDTTKRVENQQSRQKRYADESRNARQVQLTSGEWVRVRVQVRD